MNEPVRRTSKPVRWGTRAASGASGPGGALHVGDASCGRSRTITAPSARPATAVRASRSVRSDASSRWASRAATGSVPGEGGGARIHPRAERAHPSNAPPVDDAPVLRARHRHVQQTRRLGEVLGTSEGERAVARLAAEIEREPIVVLGVVEPEHRHRWGAPTPRWRGTARTPPGTRGPWTGGPSPAPRPRRRSRAGSDRHPHRGPWRCPSRARRSQWSRPDVPSRWSVAIRWSSSDRWRRLVSARSPPALPEHPRRDVLLGEHHAKRLQERPLRPERAPPVELLGPALPRRLVLLGVQQARGRPSRTSGWRAPCAPPHGRRGRPTPRAPASRSSASSESNTEASPCSAAGTPRSWRAACSARACRFVRTSTAMSPGRRGRAASAGPMWVFDWSNRTTSAAIWPGPRVGEPPARQRGGFGRGASTGSRRRRAAARTRARRARPGRGAARRRPAGGPRRRTRCRGSTNGAACAANRARIPWSTPGSLRQFTGSV